MKESLLTILRNKETPRSEFRRASDKLSKIIAAECALKVKQKSISVQTSLAPANGFAIAQKTVLIPILRAGIALLPSFIYQFDEAAVGFFGLRRDEKTAKPHLYYENLPPIQEDEFFFLLDPMIATGGSSLLAIGKLIEYGAKQTNIMLVGIIAAPEGIQAIQSKYTEISLHVVAIDEKLNDSKFIVPGLGDFGDRYFGT